MFAVVRTGGKQYKVAPSDRIVVEKLAGEAGASIDIPEVLMVSDGATTMVGKPRVDGARVTASVVNQDRADKITVFKFKRRQKYRRTHGHRQDVTVLRIEEIAAPGMTTARAEPVRQPKAREAAPDGEAAAAKPAKKAPAKKALSKKAAAARAPARKSGATKSGTKKPAAKSKSPSKPKAK